MFSCIQYINFCYQHFGSFSINYIAINKYYNKSKNLLYQNDVLILFSYVSQLKITNNGY